MLVSFFITFILFFIGTICRDHHSKYPDIVVGYRTKRAIENKENWEFTNEYAGNLFIISSRILLILDLVVLVLDIKELTILLFFINIVISVYVVFKVEKTLRKKNLKVK